MRGHKEHTLRYTLHTELPYLLKQDNQQGPSDHNVTAREKNNIQTMFYSNHY